MEDTVPVNTLPFQSVRSTVMPGLTKEMFRSSTVMLTSMVVVLEMMITVSPLLTSAPSARVQVVTVPSMGATALKLFRAF